MNSGKQQEIFNEQKREKRKKITLFIFKTSGILILFFLLFYLYTTYISSRVLSIREDRIIDKMLPESFNGIKVAHFSDLHYGSLTFMDETKKLVKELNARTPDLVLFTGDLIDKNYVLTKNEKEVLIKQLSNISASLGKYAIAGEEDDDDYYIIMKQSGFIVLENNFEFIYNDSNTPIMLIGLGSKLNNKLSIAEGFQYFNDPTHNTDIFTITLFHEPDVIDLITKDNLSNLYLAGHSHNGTIVLPFFGGIYKPEGAEKYYDKYYKVNNNNFYITSGIGTNGPGFRLFCRPGFNFYRISNK